MKIIVDNKNILFTGHFLVTVSVYETGEEKMDYKFLRFKDHYDEDQHVANM